MAARLLALLRGGVSATALCGTRVSGDRQPGSTRGRRRTGGGVAVERHVERRGAVDGDGDVQLDGGRHRVRAVLVEVDPEHGGAGHVHLDGAVGGDPAVDAAGAHLPPDVVPSGRRVRVQVEVAPAIALRTRSAEEPRRRADAVQSFCMGTVRPNAPFSTTPCVQLARGSHRAGDLRVCIGAQECHQSDDCDGSDGLESNHFTQKYLTRWYKGKEKKR